MKKLYLLPMITILMIGCGEKETDLEVGEGRANIAGDVKDSQDLEPVPGAFVRTTSHLETTVTDSNGHYDLEIVLSADATETITLEIYKEGYITEYLGGVLKAGETTVMPVVTLDRYLDSTIIDTGAVGSGSAEHISVVSVDPDTLGVVGAGGESVSIIICEVTDGIGRPVDSLHVSQVNFELIEDPSGGAHVYPLTGVTDSNGMVTTTFHSGTQSGYAIIRATLANGTEAAIAPAILIYETGDPASIELVSVEHDSIAVAGVGANETSTMTVMVKDAGGSPLSAYQPVTVKFEILGNTGGGEYLYPDSAETDALGQASTTLNSGTAAGTIQLKAFLAADPSIAATPVPITIHSGLPHTDHFAVYPRYINFPGFNYYGRIDTMIAIVADVYSNPVPMGTAVYFSTDAGVIEGSGTTNAAGFASVALYSGPPSPQAAYPFGTITAQTIGEGGAILEDNTLVLFSGITQIEDVTPTGFNIGQGGQQSFTFRVLDQNGYPLAHDTKLVVETTAGGILGDVDVDFPDTQSISWTYFEFILFDDDPMDENPPVNAAVTMKVTSVNGNASVIIVGTID